MCSEGRNFHPRHQGNTHGRETRMGGAENGRQIQTGGQGRRLSWGAEIVTFASLTRGAFAHINCSRAASVGLTRGCFQMTSAARRRGEIFIRKRNTEEPAYFNGEKFNIFHILKRSRLPACQSSRGDSNILREITADAFCVPINY